jgi:tetratricopeptide (TPR) repeat protein
MMARSLLGLSLLASGLAACATNAPASKSERADTPRRIFASRERDTTAEAYYHYAVAQMLGQNGRFKDAIPPMEEALRQDPNSAFLWATLAQWLVRAEQPVEALAAARRAVQLAPDEVQPHMTLAELLRGQKKYAEAEAELERVVALNPNSE